MTNRIAQPVEALFVKLRFKCGSAVFTEPNQIGAEHAQPSRFVCDRG
jgi:hypothetical protein